MRFNGWKRKALIITVLTIFVGWGIIPSTQGIIDKNILITNPKSGGYIQGLIDNATAGDTIYIPSGTYYENIVIDKSINLVGEDKNTTIIDGSESWDVVHVTANWVNLSGFTIRNGRYGVLIHSNYNTIMGNNISSNNWAGIEIYSKEKNNIIDNTISLNNRSGIYFVDSSSTNINGNIITSNRDYGICLWGNLSGNNISGNSFVNDSLYYTLTETYLGNIIIDNNTVNGKPLHVLKDESNKIISDAGQIILVNCKNIVVQNSNISNTDIGIDLRNSDDCRILDSVIISNNMIGIRLYKSSGNTITGNNISLDNGVGISLFAQSDSNTISDNLISNNNNGITISICSYNTISNNIISNNLNAGVKFDQLSYTNFRSHIISNNIIQNNQEGIFIDGCDKIIFKRNHIAENTIGIKLSHGEWESTRNNKFIQNNLIDNDNDVDYPPRSWIIRNRWRGNYWNSPRLLPKIVFFGMVFYGIWPMPIIPIIIPYIVIDWFPAQEPYDIGVGI